MAEGARSVTADRYRELIRAVDRVELGYPDAFITAAARLNREWGSSGYRIGYLGNGYFGVRHADGSRFVLFSDQYGNFAVVEGPEPGQSRRRSAPRRASAHAGAAHRHTHGRR